MKKTDTYYLSKEVIQRIKDEAKLDSRSKSDWLNLHLTKFFEKGRKPTKVITSISSYDEEFNLVWEIYEKKGNKKTSLAKFNKLTNKQKLLMVKNLPAYVKSTPDKQFRKNLETYINQECWNDEIVEVSTNGQQDQARFETTTDRYERQSRELQERETAARRNKQDSTPFQDNGVFIRG